MSVYDDIAHVGDTIPDPAKIQAQNLALQNERQSLALGKVQLQEATEQQQARRAMNDVFAQAAQQGRVPTQAEILSKGGVHAAPVLKNMLDAQHSQAELDELHSKVASAEQDYMGAKAAQAEALGSTPEALRAAFSDVPALYKAHADQLIAAVNGDPEHAKQAITAMKAASASQRKIGAEETAANARQTTAQVGAAKLPGELQAQDLGIQSKQQEVTGTKPIQPAEAANIANTQAGRTEQQRHNRIEEQQGGARVGIAGAELGLKQKQFNATYGAGLGEDGKPLDQSKTGEDYLKMLPAGIANQVRGIATGALAMPPAGSRAPQAQVLRNAVMQYDPTFNEQRAQVRKAFTTGSDGRNIGALNTATVHLDQLDEAAQAMKNGSFTPKNAVFNKLITTFGGAAPTNFEGVKAAVSSEMASALKGNATDQEIHAMAANTQSASSPEQLSGIISQNLHILGAKLNTYQERYSAQNPGDKVWSPVLPSAKAVYDKHRIQPTAGPGVNVKSRSGGGTVKMISPTGQIADVPADQVEHYKQKGAKPYR